MTISFFLQVVARVIAVRPPCLVLIRQSIKGSSGPLIISFFAVITHLLL